MSRAIGAAAQALRVAAVCVGAGVYLATSHAAIATGARWAVLWVLAPTSLLLAGWVGLRHGRRVGLASGLLLLAAIAALQPQLAAQGRWLYGAEHVGFHLALALWFGHTLIGAREPLVTRFARSMRAEPLPPRVRAYTRAVTWAWTALFVAIATISATLLVLAPLPVWSVFANLLSLPLCAALFVGEYALRRWWLSEWAHEGLLDGLHAYRRHASAQARESSRPG